MLVGFEITNTMKTKITILTVAAFAIVSLSLAQSTDSSQKADTSGVATIHELKDELIKTQVDLQKARVRIGQLEAQVRALQQEAKTNAQPRLVPLKSK